MILAPMPLTDFFIASPKELREADAAKLPDPFKTYRTKNLDAVELGTLNAILTKSPDLPALVIEVSGEGPWIMRLPAGLTKAIAEMDDKSLKRVAARWAKTEKFVMDGSTAAHAKVILENLRALATGIGRKNIYVWACL